MIIDYIDQRVDSLRDEEIYKINTSTGVFSAYKDNNERVYLFESNGQDYRLTGDQVENMFYSGSWTIDSISQFEYIEKPEQELNQEYDKIISKMESNAKLQKSENHKACMTIANQNTRFMSDAVERGKVEERIVGDCKFGVGRTEDGELRYFIADEKGARNVSKPDFIERMTKEEIKDFRRNNYIDFDFVMKTKNDIIAVDYNDGRYDYVRITPNGESKSLTRDELREVVKDDQIVDVSPNTSIEKAMLSESHEKTVQTAKRPDMEIDSDIIDESSMGRKSMIHEIARENDSSKRALKAALRHAEQANSLYNEKANEAASKTLMEMERQCEPGKSVSKTINNVEFTVEKDKDGRISYRTTQPEPPQEMNRRSFSDALFVEHKRESYEISQEKGLELAIIPLNKEQMLVIRPQDIGTKAENSFRDGNDNYNYFLVSTKNGSEKQISEKEVKHLFSKHNITEKEVKETITHSLAVAKENAKNLTKSAARSAGNIAKNAFDRHVIGQMSQGLSMGEEVARVL